MPPPPIHKFLLLYKHNRDRGTNCVTKRPSRQPTDLVAEFHVLCDGLVKVGHTGVLGPPATEECILLYRPDVEPARVQMDEGGKEIYYMYICTCIERDQELVHCILDRTH